jgi:hypothetical protein
MWGVWGMFASVFCDDFGASFNVRDVDGESGAETEDI